MIILLAALHTADSSQVKALVDPFYRERTKADAYQEDELNSDITPIENTFETSEGTARYLSTVSTAVSRKKLLTKSC
jgi:hypothetical protein